MHQTHARTRIRVPPAPQQLRVRWRATALRSAAFAGAPLASTGPHAAPVVSARLRAPMHQPPASVRPAAAPRTQTANVAEACDAAEATMRRGTAHASARTERTCGERRRKGLRGGKRREHVTPSILWPPLSRSDVTRTVCSWRGLGAVTKRTKLRSRPAALGKEFAEAFAHTHGAEQSTRHTHGAAVDAGAARGWTVGACACARTP